MSTLNKKKVIIIDYKLGNLFSVNQACKTLGITSIVSSKKSDLYTADGIILPGVGAFNEAMDNLKRLDLINAIKEKVSEGTPIFGICLGLQLLFDKSEEFGNFDGLSLVSGKIKKFPNIFLNKKLKVPHVSWNNLDLNEEVVNTSPLKLLNNKDYMYFIHSYYVVPVNKNIILSTTNYSGITFCSSIHNNNIFATQFHPEKSADKGLEIYNQWATEYNLK